MEGETTFCVHPLAGWAAPLVQQGSPPRLAMANTLVFGHRGRGFNDEAMTIGTETATRLGRAANFGMPHGVGGLRPQAINKPLLSPRAGTAVQSLSPRHAKEMYLQALSPRSGQRLLHLGAIEAA